MLRSHDLSASQLTWMDDLEDRSIRFDVVSPAATETKLMRGRFDAAPQTEAEVIKRVPLGRLHDVANAVLFLASSESSFVAGHEIFVDCGVAAV